MQDHFRHINKTKGIWDDLEFMESEKCHISGPQIICYLYAYRNFFYNVKIDR